MPPAWLLFARYWLLIPALLIFVCGFAWLQRSGRESPIVYEGRPVAAWLDSGYEDAARALYDIGPAAIPAVFSKLRWEHPRLGYWQRYAPIWKSVPLPFRRLLPKPRTVCFDEWRACSSLSAIGPRAIPTLITGLHHRSVLVRVVCAQTIAELGNRGCNIRRAVPSLEAALDDPELGVRKQAERALLRISQR